MQYAIKSAQGFQIKELCRLKSNGKRLDFSADVTANWTDTSLGTLTDDVAMRFLTVYGQLFNKDYKSKISGWTKGVQKALDSLEKTLIKAEKAFEKAAKKKPPTPQEIDAFLRDQNARQTNELQSIQDDAQSDFQKMVLGLTDSVYKATLKKMGDTGKLFKKSKGALVWSVIKFVAAGVAVTAAVLALPPVGAALAFGAGVVLIAVKGLTSTRDFVKDCIAFKKQFDTATAKVAAQVSNATQIVEKAISDMRTAKSAADSLKVKLAQAEAKLNEVKQRTGPEKKNKEFVKAKAKLDKASEDLKALNKAVGGNPDDVLGPLQDARAALKKASAAMPVKQGGGNPITAILSGLDDAISTMEDFTS